MSPSDNDTDDLLEQVSSMADRMGLEGKDRSSYIHEHMIRSGYRAEPTYVREEQEQEDEESGKGGFFSTRKEGAERSKGSSRDRGSRREQGGEDWYK